MTFHSPVRDLLFTLNEVVGIDVLTGREPFADLDQDTLTAVLAAAGAFSDELLAPLNRAATWLAPAMRTAA